MAENTPNLKSKSVRPLDMKIAPLVLTTDCIIAVGANHFIISAVKPHCFPKKTFM
ncbi:hypothetical protein SPRA44_220115 [Serratia proteamaculans]|nr:hypothetical protein SPRA44_220115 [Serratia proteamaculans]